MEFIRDMVLKTQYADIKLVAIGDYLLVKSEA